MSDVVKLGVQFEVEPDEELQALGHTTPYRDTLWITEDEYGAPLTPEVVSAILAGEDETVNAMKAARHANWVQVVTTPAEEPAPEEE